MQRDSHVVIGVTTEVLDAPWYEGRRRYQLFTDYSRCLREAGAMPLLIPGDTPPEDLPALLDRVDGVLTSGGDDADLRPLGGPAPTAECKPVPIEQQEMNLELARLVVERDMPLLAVCFGMQMLGLAHGARFEQHMKEHEDHTRGVEHAVQLTAGSRLAELIGSASIEVPSFHHQALLDCGQDLQPAGHAPDGTLEAVELADSTFAFGVQWHPERAPDSAATRALFSRFAEAARAYRSLQTA